MTDDPVAYLEAAITRAEDQVRRADKDASRDWDASWDPGTDTFTLTGGGTVIAEGFLHSGVIGHIIHNDPAAVLRRCAADRKILALHHAAQRSGWNPDDDDTSGAYGTIARACAECGSDAQGVRIPCATIRALAEGYGWTGDTEEFE